ncbi:aldose 1-epimerase family protein [Poseidonibacter ostreae]|uniref:Aldose 1-epimerase family protein n=1 Tax=Poseidonibacter ostreae TaxID=2654171 RepID=A0A6L4WT67_9BACT|nr:aldose 1-epimerase family protein [Poseidonibacter ostreae]KAB7882998.1 aldose 1-epimerase family protein [Poseidonibacter ostreae]KAB7886648.1 aldose 1-epimerase family protein [Poseidonibacter ostreae]KAB7889258.1 aldose 1-epimerase family protein [Poseidonibacter ostreae]
MEYTIKNKHLEIKVDSFGAELKSLKKLQNDIEYLWQGDAKFWNRTSPVLFPIVGKLLDDEYFYKNKSYKMSQHGFARDKEFVLVEQGENYLKFLLQSDLDSLKVYPFVYQLFISYEIKENEVKISYQVVNKSDEKMYFSIGAHPAFNWPLEKETEDKNDYYFEFENLDEDKNLKAFPLLNNGISSEKIDIELDKKRFNISKDSFKKDALIFKNESINSVKLKNYKNDKFIEVCFNGFSYLGLWSKPSGAPFVCIEPWYGIADFINHNKNIEEKEGINILEKNAVFSSFYKIKI